MRLLLFGLALLAIGVGGGTAVAWVMHSGTHTHTIQVTTTTVEVVNGSRSAALIPAPIPTHLAGPTDPHRLAISAAVPIDANLESADFVERKPSQLVVTWERAHLTRAVGASWQRHGIAIWQHDPGHAASWHRVYTYEATVKNPVYVEGFRVALGDISGDGRPEILVFYDTDGSAGNGTYHLFVNSGYRVRQPLVRRLSTDEGTISFADGVLVVLEGRGAFRGRGIHCCYRNVRETWLRWRGRRLITVRQMTRKNRSGWPPG